MKKDLASIHLDWAKINVTCALHYMRRLRLARYKDGDRAHAIIETIINDLKPKPAMLNELSELLDDDVRKVK